MVLIDSSENLLSSAIRNKVQAAYPGDLLLASRYHGSEWLQSLKHRVKDRLSDYPFIKCFVVEEYPLNVYDIYDQVKTILRTISQLPVQDVYLHVVIKLGMQDVWMAEQIRSQCSYLASLVGQISANGPYRLHAFFSCAYNVFGIVHSKIPNTGSNNVQTLLYLLKNPTRSFTVPYGKNEDVIGSDIEDLASLLLQWTDQPGDNTTLRFLPVNIPVTAGSLIEAVAQTYPKTYHTIKFSEGPGIGKAAVQEALRCGVHGASIRERFLAYLDGQPD